MIDLPFNITSIDRYTFYGCSSLRSITLPSTITTLGTDFFKNCSFLVSVHLPTSLAKISLSVFQGCSQLTTINTTSFSTTTFGNSDGEFEVLLVNADFSSINLNTILYVSDDSDSSQSDDFDLYYNMKHWGRTKDEDYGRLFLYIAVARSLIASIYVSCSWANK